MKTEYEAYLVRIRGVVTGVGFRYATRAFVFQFPEVKGYVRNVCEGQVEILVQGKKEHLEVIISWLKHGPSYARIDEIKINSVPVSRELEYFRIR